MPAELDRLRRVFVFFWRGLGSARRYVAAAAGIVVVLAGVGIWHLASSPNRKSPTVTSTARISPGAERSLAPTPTSSPKLPAERARQVEITRIDQTDKRGRQGETFVVATIGLASQGNAEKGDVEIHVYFYDLTRDNEMRPTDAQVTYEWLTPVRDWSDPAPKYLAATYFRSPVRQRSAETLRYGGCVVRVFSGGKLQDEQSQPESLLALFHNAAEQVSRTSTAANSSATPVPVTSARTPAIPSPSPASTDPVEDTALPYGKPIPGKPGFLNSPYDEKFIIDVRGFPPGTLVNDPNTNKPFRVP
ncbi:MAG TPA: hypothetical protein VM940_00990 [Chthoniobacterales bacterium]|nr:hypothetical protein [Chthoniobacterales bacterium]